VPLPAGEPYKPVLPQNATDRLRQAYWDIGFNDMETEYALKRNQDAGTVDLLFRITENRQDVVREIVVEGTDHTSRNMVMTQVKLEPGDIVNLERLAESRRNLYGTGAYSLVELQREEIGAGDAANGQTRARSAEPMEKPVRLTVRVREIQPFEVRYGAFIDTERGPGGIFELSNHNMLGSARVLGFRGRLDSQLREARIYFSQPLLLRFPFETIASPYVRYERNPATSTTDPFNVDRIGFSVQQEARWANKFIFNYGYRIERTRTYDPSGDDSFDVPLRIGALTTTFSRETRDDILDATRGSFFSQAFQWSPALLGSQLRFVKYFGQYFKYFPLQEPRVELFTNEVLRPRLVFATGVRVGLARGFGGQQVPLVERFFAGGSTTLRAFEQNTVGPIDEFDRQPLGGEGMFVLNNELRFPLFSIFDGVGFLDIGNVYSRVTDFSFGDLRKAVGAGVRVRTPWFLLRADYGIKVDTRPGEPRGRFFFSIGQAF
jgi:outer membrane protein assembly factor BamA